MVKEEDKINHFKNNLFQQYRKYNYFLRLYVCACKKLKMPFKRACADQKQAFILCVMNSKCVVHVYKLNKYLIYN